MIRSALLALTLLAGLACTQAVPQGQAQPVAQAPVFTVQPKGITSSVGDRVSFRVDTSAFPPAAIQWQVKKFEAIQRYDHWEDLADEHGVDLGVSVSSVSLDQYEYRCIATNNAGVAISDVAVLHVVD